MTRQSPTKSRELREFRAAADERETWTPRCEWPRCAFPWTQRHHSLKARFWKHVLPNQRANIPRLLCDFHHDRAELHPAEARALDISMELHEAVARGYAVRTTKGAK